MSVCTRIAHEEHPIGLLRILAFAVAVVTPMCGQSLDETLMRMDKTAQQFKSVTASMKRDVHTSVINDDSIDTGTIKVKREKSHDTRMLVDITGRDAKTVSLEDSTVSVYYPKIKTVQKYDVGEKKQLVEQFLLLGFGASAAELKQVYDISWAGPETIAGQSTGHLKLNPKSKDVARQVTSAELWMSTNNGLPLRQKIVFSSGDYWLVDYSDLKFNPTLSDDDLKLKYPKGVQIDHPRF
ncbi:MAG TPA: sigma-E factor regulatory protein RseB domain-containing protein [Bryobacteraceae bacterium]|jgi:outer membrane lipoprotein-sorting protein|nr:sigma-E factor regulatory protein RseB domain-containing protein [Bryobacteraceae bacterium]